MKRDAKYYDGKTPMSHIITCFLDEDKLTIVNSSTEEIIEVWERDHIYQDETHNTAFVLGSSQSNSKIELLNLEIAEKLGLKKESVIVKDHKAIYKWVILFIGCIAIAWLSIPFLTKIIAKQIPYGIEVSASSRLSLDKYFKICKVSKEERAALNSYAQYLYPKTAAESAMPVHFDVSSESMINALTFPGGKIILFKGLIDEVKNPEELLGIMSHELGHVVARDSVNLLVRGTLLASFFGIMTGDFSSSFAVSPQVLLSTAALAFDREMEKNADAYSVARLNSLNISTSGYRSFFSRRLSEENFSQPEVFTTHPNYESRLSFIQETYPKGELPKEIKESWKIIKGVCRN
jgi:Zn-dependent protease with chaperone function